MLFEFYRYVQVSAENSGNLRELGLKTLSALLENFADIEPSALVKPVETVSNIINSLPPNCLFTDWSPYHVINLVLYRIYRSHQEKKYH